MPNDRKPGLPTAEVPEYQRCPWWPVRVAQRLCQLEGTDYGPSEEERELIREHVSAWLSQAYPGYEEHGIDVCHDGEDEYGRMIYFFAVELHEEDETRDAEDNPNGYVHGNGRIEGLY